jgi:hypothetical protein
MGCQGVCARLFGVWTGHGGCWVRRGDCPSERPSTASSHTRTAGSLMTWVLWGAGLLQDGEET